MLKINKFSPINFFKKYNCINCHGFSKIKSASSFFDISKKYKNNKSERKKMYNIIKKGSCIKDKVNIMPSYKNIKNKNIYNIVK